MLDDFSPTGPESLLDPAEGHDAEECDTDDLAVDVELELLRCGIANPDRPGVLVAGKVLQLELSQAPLPRDSVHDLDLGRVARADSHQVVPEGHCLLRVAGVE